MGKSIRSKIKKYWRSQLRSTIGTDNLLKQEEKIQIELQKAIKSQAGNSLFTFQKSLGTTASPVISEESQDRMKVVEDETMGDTESELLNSTADISKKSTKKIKPTKSAGPKRKKRSKKFVHFHTLRKKGE